MRFINAVAALSAAVLPSMPLLSGAFDSGAGEAPNVVLVITDDQGYGDLSCHGNPVLKTPALDRLHKQSIRLANYHVSPTCAPTRGSLMSGLYSNRSGAWHTIMGRSLLFEGLPTLAELFRTKGYRTGLFGKWHLGDNYPYRPEDRGFDEVVRHGGGGEGQTPDAWNNAYFDSRYFHNGKLRSYSGYCTDVFFEEAIRFMGDSKEAGDPFFAYISPNAPHSPFHCPDKYWKPYLDAGRSEREAVFFGMIANIDENVGRLRAWLRKEGLERNTLFIFTTDNGTATGEEIFNAGMRGKKNSEYDGGHRVPFFLFWPQGGMEGGRDIPELTAHIDVLPTLAELCGLDVPAGYEPDGRSLARLLYGQPHGLPDRILITDSQRLLHPQKWRKSAVMTQRWRLINGTELYDISTDPGQQEDVAPQFPDTVRRLRESYDAWWESLQSSLDRVAAIPIGYSGASPVMLTAHDWFDQGAYGAWNQQQIRSGGAPIAEKGIWAIEAKASGIYRIELFRWPPGLNLPIASDLPPADPVPGLMAFRETPGKGLKAVSARLVVGGTEKAWDVDSGQPSAAVEIPISAGRHFLEASFQLEDGKEVGAFYSRVQILDPP